MKRRTEHLVEKRDGRREFLRATKLARSVHLALYEIGVDEDWRALEVASVVLEGLRQKRKAAQLPAGVGASSGLGAASSVAGPVVLTTTEIADSVQHLLVVTGQPTAAVAYGAVQAERARRRRTVGVGAAGSSAAGVGVDCSRSDLPQSDLPQSSLPQSAVGPVAKAGPRSPKAGKAENEHLGKPSLKPVNRIWGEG